jgi:hypothetical protein
MMNIFEKVYLQTQAAQKAYDEAADGAGREKACELYRKAMKQIESLGNTGLYVWKCYEESRNNGNELLNFDGIIVETHAHELVQCMRENGIKQFTFSSDWNTRENSWAFSQSGCVIEGMTEINGDIAPFTEKRQKLHAYLFRV